MKQQRTPMPRGSGFKRPEYIRKPPSPLSKGRMARMTGGDGDVVAVPKEPKPVRDEAYRRLVAQLPCFQCRVEGASQCAHPNTGKAKGRKTSDLLTFPMCHVGAKDCHARFDQYKLVPKAQMPDYERRAYHWTVRELLARGMWPAWVAVPDLRTFN